MSTLAWACCENGWWSDSNESPVWRISAGKSPQREAIAAIQGYLQVGSGGLRNVPQQMGNLDIWVFSLEASPILRRHLFSRPRQGGSPKTNKIRELDRGWIVFVLIVEEIVTLKLAFSATLDVVPRSLFRARYHNLLRLKDAYSVCF